MCVFHSHKPGEHFVAVKTGMFVSTPCIYRMKLGAHVDIFHRLAKREKRNSDMDSQFNNNLWFYIADEVISKAGMPSPPMNASRNYILIFKFGLKQFPIHVSALFVREIITSCP